MGLAAPKVRSKIGNDPNNTAWSKSTSRFGHKILTSQGWTPGSTLGAIDASHASHFTAASSSHIRVLLRDDNLGLGAQRGRQDGDNFGLDMFQGLLGRLNGKSESELAKEAGVRRDLRLKEVVVKRFGGTTFVSGGYLVGDKMEITKEKPADMEAVEPAKEKRSKSKKRKRNEDLAEEASESTPAAEKQEASTEEEKPKKKRKDKDDKKKSKKDKKRKREEELVEEDTASTNEAEVVEELAQFPEPDALASQSRQERKAAKRAAKEARRAEKAERKRLKALGADAAQSEPATAAITPVEVSEAEAASDVPATAPVSGASTPVPAALARGRFAVRSRYMAQKRMAVSDAQALKEIFMIKTTG